MPVTIPGPMGGGPFSPFHHHPPGLMPGMSPGLMPGMNGMDAGAGSSCQVTCGPYGGQCFRRCCTMMPAMMPRGQTGGSSPHGPDAGIRTSAGLLEESDEESDP